MSDVPEGAEEAPGTVHSADDPEGEWHVKPENTPEEETSEVDQNDE